MLKRHCPQGGRSDQELRPPYCRQRRIVPRYVVGEMFGFLGPNGSGKTTTIRMCLGIIRPNHRLARDPRSSTRAPHSQARRLSAPQERGLTKQLKVVEVLRYLGRLKGMSVRAAEERALQLLKRVDLYEHRDKADREPVGGHDPVRAIHQRNHP